MTSTQTEPISSDWTIDGPEHFTDGRHPATAVAVNQQLALIEIADIEPRLAPFLAAAAAELALSEGIAWAFSDDDPPVALVRLIAKVAGRNPTANGPHTGRLLAELTS